jgi:hypothetical protein
MAITVTIGGVDKSSFIDWQSLRVEQQITSQVDSAGFIIKKYGTKNYAPSIGDSVLIQDGATNVFGGSVARINNTVQGTLLIQSVECVSHERTLDRYLVTREITNKNAFYVINTIIAEFVNRVYKEVDLGESNETWTTEDGVVAANAVNGQYIQGDQSRKLTASASSTATARRESTLDLTTFTDGTAVVTSDIVKLWIYVDTPANFASLRIRFVSDAGGTYTNYFEHTYSTAPVTGWNELRIPRSSFSTVGAPSWSSILKRQYRATATAAGTVNVSVDDVRIVQATTYFSQAGVRDAQSPFLGSVKFNYEQGSAAIKEVAEAVGNDWYVDPLRVLYFYQPASISAPFSLTDTSANFIWNSLQVNRDISTIKNQVYVRGGEYQGVSTDFDVEADGIALNYRSPYRIKNLTVTVAAVGKTVGVDNLDDPASFDCLYNYQEKTLKFKAATKPTAGQTVRMTGNPMIPVIVKKGDPTSISTYGIFEFAIIDKSIITQQAARDRATAELRNYRNNLLEGTFKTTTSGLRAGQIISINNTTHNINETFVIKSLIFTCRSPDTFFYETQLVSTRTFGIIEYLLGLLRDQKKQIQINDNEVVDLVQEITEEITIADAWVQKSNNLQSETITFSEVNNSQLNHGTIFVYAPYNPINFADTKRPFILSGSPLG